MRSTDVSGSRDGSGSRGCSPEPRALSSAERGGRPVSGRLRESARERISLRSPSRRRPAAIPAPAAASLRFFAPDRQPEVASSSVPLGSRGPAATLLLAACVAAERIVPAPSCSLPSGDRTCRATRPPSRLATASPNTTGRARVKDPTRALARTARARNSRSPAMTGASDRRPLTVGTPRGSADSSRGLRGRCPGSGGGVRAKRTRARLRPRPGRRVARRRRG